MPILKVLSGFLPWLVFSLLATRAVPGAVTTAALVAFLVAAAFVVRSRIRGRSPKLLEVTGALTFAVFGVVGALDPGADAFFAHYGRALAALTLAVIIFALLPVMPFTEQYARETVPQQYWHSPVFRSVNRRISAAWGLVIVGHSVCHTLAGVLSDPGTNMLNQPVDLLFNWVAPVLLTLWAWHYTARVANAAHDAAADRVESAETTRNIGRMA